MWQPGERTETNSRDTSTTASTTKKEQYRFSSFNNIDLCAGSFAGGIRHNDLCWKF
jgi:hypothetical protein